MAGKKMVSLRLNEMTLEQLSSLQHDYGYTQTKLVQLAVNMLYKEVRKIKVESLPNREDVEYMQKLGLRFIQDNRDYINQLV